jgi:4'-phosphopantetheinyl transferase
LWTRWLHDDAPEQGDPTVPAAVLTKAERQQWARFRHSADRNLFHASRMLQYEVGSQLLGHAVVIDRKCVRCGEQHGRPSWLGAGKLDYSVSHSGNVVVMIVVNGGRVGIDIESTRSLRRGTDGWLNMAADVLTAAEAETLPGSSPTTAERDFLRLWCRKEAVVKLTGAGLLAELTTIDVRDHTTAAPDDGTELWLRDLPMPSGYVGAVASTIPDLIIDRV